MNIRTSLVFSVAWFLAASGCHKAETPSPPTAEVEGAQTAPPPGQKGTETQANAPQQSAPRDERLCSRWISGKEAMSIVESGGLLLDVRTPEEYAEGHLEGSKNIPVDDLETRLQEIDPGKPVVVYCHSGKRAHRAATILADKGRTVSEIGRMAQYQADAPAGCGD